MMKWLRKLLDDPTDPVRHCDLYKDKAAGSCSHVDGPLCDFPGCSMLAEYRAKKEVASSVLEAQPQPSDQGEGKTNG